MDGHANIFITIEHKLFFQTKWTRLEMAPEAYFDLGDDEAAETDSVPIYAHAIEYLENVPKRDVELTKITIKDRMLGKTRVITEMFWNGGENRVIERTDISGQEHSDWEIILNVVVSETPYISESIRLGRPSDITTILSHVFIERLADGTERERAVYSRSR